MASTACTITAYQSYRNGSAVSGESFGAVPASDVYFALRLTVKIPYFTGTIDSLTLTVSGKNVHAGSSMSGGKTYCMNVSTSAAHSTYISGTASEGNAGATAYMSGSLALNASTTLYFDERALSSSYSPGDTLYIYIWGADATSVYSRLEYTGATCYLNYTEEQTYAYTISYDANGGYGAPASHVEEGDKKAFWTYLSGYEPTREGFEFLGWSESWDAEFPDYEAGEEIYITGDKYLFAVWKVDLPDYTITLTRNTETISTVSGGGVYEQGETATVRAVLKSIAGYDITFKGWRIGGADGIVINTNKSYGFEVTGDLTLYADATKELAKYIITYSANGGTGAPSTHYKTHGEDAKISDTIPTYTGRTFRGWSTTKNGAAQYQPGDTYSVNAALTLYAVWELNTYSVKYDANGGEGAPEEQTKTYGVPLELSEEVPVRSGYNFAGWNTAQFATTATYQPGDMYELNFGITMYAVWEKVVAQQGAFLYGKGGAWVRGEVYVGKGGEWVPASALAGTADGWKETVAE